VIDAASSRTFDELLGHIGLARAHGAVTAAALLAPLSPTQDDVLVELCTGLVARSEQDVDRIALALQRRTVPDRDARLLHLAAIAEGQRAAELLAIFDDGKALLVERPLAADDRGAPIEAVRIAEHGRSALVHLADGVAIELVASALRGARVSTPPAGSGFPATLGDVDGVRLGQRLRALRLAAGLTQAELARRTGIHRPNIARVEAGRHTPSLETLARLAAAIGVSTTRVLSD